MRSYWPITALIISLALAGCRGGRVTTTHSTEVQRAATQAAADSLALQQREQGLTAATLTLTDSVVVETTHVALSAPDSLGYQHPTAITRTVATRAPRLIATTTQATGRTVEMQTSRSQLTQESLSTLVAGETVERKPRTRWHTWPLIILSAGVVLVVILFLRRFKII